MDSGFFISKQRETQKTAPRLILVNRQGIQDFQQAPQQWKDLPESNVWNLEAMDDNHVWFRTNMELLQYDMYIIYI